MKRLLPRSGMLVLLLIPLHQLGAAPFRDSQIKTVRKLHKAQNRDIKQDQRAMKRAMAQHELSRDSRRRFRHNLSMQRQMLRRSQKAEMRDVKQRHKLLRKQMSLRRRRGALRGGRP